MTPRSWFARPTRSFALLLALSLAAACSGATSEGGDARTETSVLPDVASTPDGGACCPIDPAPGCCMRYGGWSADGQSCLPACDGMVVPGDPGWMRSVDAHGCPYWAEPPHDGRALCGQPWDASGPGDAAPDVSGG